MRRTSFGLTLRRPSDCGFGGGGFWIWGFNTFTHRWVTQPQKELLYNLVVFLDSQIFLWHHNQESIAQSYPMNQVCPCCAHAQEALFTLMSWSMPVALCVLHGITLENTLEIAIVIKCNGPGNYGCIMVYHVLLPLHKLYLLGWWLQCKILISMYEFLNDTGIWLCPICRTACLHFFFFPPLL